MSHTNLLEKLACRIFSTACNFVAHERAFSIWNLIHTKSHSCLKVETTNKLMYINARIVEFLSDFTQFPNRIKVKNMCDMTMEEEIMMENALLGIEMDKNSTIMDIDEARSKSDTRERCIF